MKLTLLLLFVAVFAPGIAYITWEAFRAPSGAAKGSGAQPEGENRQRPAGK